MKMMDMRKSKKSKDPAELLKMAGLDSSVMHGGGNNPGQSKARTASAPPQRPAPKHQQSMPQQPVRPTTASSHDRPVGQKAKPERKQLQPVKRPHSTESRKSAYSDRGKAAHHPPRERVEMSRPVHSHKRGVSAHSTASERKKKGKRSQRVAHSAIAQENLTKDEAQH